LDLAINGAVELDAVELSIVDVVLRSNEVPFQELALLASEGRKR